MVVKNYKEQFVVTVVCWT